MSDEKIMYYSLGMECRAFFRDLVKLYGNQMICSSSASTAWMNKGKNPPHHVGQHSAV